MNREQISLDSTLEKVSRKTSNESIPLPMINSGSTVYVSQIHGRKKDIGFLENLGFVANSPINIISELNGDLILNVKGTRIALGKSMAMKILVKQSL